LAKPRHEVQPSSPRGVAGRALSPVDMLPVLRWEMTGALVARVCLLAVTQADPSSGGTSLCDGTVTRCLCACCKGWSCSGRLDPGLAAIMLLGAVFERYPAARAGMLADLAAAHYKAKFWQERCSAPLAWPYRCPSPTSSRRKDHPPPPATRLSLFTLAPAFLHLLHAAAALPQRTNLPPCLARPPLKADVEMEEAETPETKKGKGGKKSAAKKKGGKAATRASPCAS